MVKVDTLAVEYQLQFDVVLSVVASVNADDVHHLTDFVL